MDIHVSEHSITTSGGSGSINTLPIIGGLCRQIYVLASNTTNTFRFDVANDDGLYVRNYNFHKGEINDDANILPMRGVYTLRVMNAQSDDTFEIRMLIEQ